MKDGNIYIFEFKYTKYNYFQLKVPLGYSVNHSSFITCIKNSSGVIMAEFHSLWKNITYQQRSFNTFFWREDY